MIDFKRLDHVLITIPPDSKEAAQAFYTDVLRLKEIREEEGHKADSDRHPAFEVNDLPAAKEFLERQNIEISFSSEIEGRERCFFRDPFGNRFELIEYKK